jgi:hypothetical protein
MPEMRVVREDQVLPFSEPLKMSASAFCLDRKDAACELQGQDQCLE